MGSVLSVELSSKDQARLEWFSEKTQRPVADRADTVVIGDRTHTVHTLGRGLVGVHEVPFPIIAMCLELISRGASGRTIRIL